MGEVSNFKLIYTENYDEMGKKVAKIIAEEIQKKPDLVLGLPTGSTPIGMYNELVKMHKKGILDFSKLITFNLDEYYPIKKTDPNSYNYYMNYWLFQHVNIDPKNVNIPNGEINEKEIKDFCKKYEEKITSIDGIDLQILGIGGYSGYKSNHLIGGHVGFNETGSDSNSRTRKVKLSSKTRLDNSRFFKSLSEVPKYSITMGIGTILEAKKIILMASGEHKAEIIKALVEGPITERIPASFLKAHEDLTIIIDKSAASQLERFKKPWLYSGAKGIDWNKIEVVELATLWLSNKVLKSITELKEKDFIENGLRTLISHYKDVDKIKKIVESNLKKKIMNEQNCPKDKKILIISPHPDDDVICLGATLHFLNKMNDLKILYATSGSKSVKDDDLFDFYQNKSEIISLLEKKINPDVELTQDEIKKINELKKSLREEEAISAVQVMGINPKNLIFLNSPFYNKRLFIDGKVRRSELKDEDISNLAEKLRELKPNIVMINGEYGDPHGTHGKTFQMFEAAIRKIENFAPEIWYYKGAWEEFPLNEIDKLFVFDKYLMDLKVRAIKVHKSQIDALYFGEDQRAFWMRALERNENTGKNLRELGVINKDFYCEAFKIKKDI